MKVKREENITITTTLPPSLMFQARYQKQQETIPLLQQRLDCIVNIMGRYFSDDSARPQNNTRIVPHKECWEEDIKNLVFRAERPATTHLVAIELSAQKQQEQLWWVKDYASSLPVW